MAEDMADVTWSPVGGAIRHITIYDDRPLTRWEWFRAKVLRRKGDPRIVYSGPPEDGQTIEVA